jgi:hypothetical protein
VRGLVAFNLWQTESLLWFCDRCDRLLHRVTMHVAASEGRLP